LCSGYFGDGSLELFAQAGLEPWSFLFSFPVARIIGVSHWHPLNRVYMQNLGSPLYVSLCWNFPLPFQWSPVLCLWFKQHVAFPWADSSFLLMSPFGVAWALRWQGVSCSAVYVVVTCGRTAPWGTYQKQNVTCTNFCLGPKPNPAVWTQRWLRQHRAMSSWSSSSAGKTDSKQFSSLCSLC
jgi:hypothetical protein